MELVSRRQNVAFVIDKFEVSERRACGLLGVDRSSHRYRRRPERRPELREELRMLAEKHPRYGYRRLTVLLHRRGQKVNHKRVQRLSRGLTLKVRVHRRKKLRGVAPAIRVLTRPNEEWTMDFVSDAAANGQTLRILTLVDAFTRECLATEVATSIGSRRVVRVLERILEERKAPATIRVDNGPEFLSRHLLNWSRQKRIGIEHIQPGKPVQNAYIESFNGRLRDKCLNVNWFRHLGDARQRIESWRSHYSRERPHSSLDYRTPAEFCAVCDSVPLPPGTEPQTIQAA